MQSVWSQRVAVVAVVLVMSATAVLAVNRQKKSHPDGDDLAITWTLIENAQDSRSHLGKRVGDHQPCRRAAAG